MWISYFRSTGEERREGGRGKMQPESKIEAANKKLQRSDLMFRWESKKITGNTEDIDRGSLAAGSAAFRDLLFRLALNWCFEINYYYYFSI